MPLIGHLFQFNTKPNYSIGLAEYSFVAGKKKCALIKIYCRCKLITRLFFFTLFAYDMSATRSILCYANDFNKLNRIECIPGDEQDGEGDAKTWANYVGRICECVFLSISIISHSTLMKVTFFNLKWKPAIISDVTNFDVIKHIARLKWFLTHINRK